MIIDVPATMNALVNGAFAWSYAMSGIQFNAHPDIVNSYLATYNCLYWRIRQGLGGNPQAQQILDQFLVDPQRWQGYLAQVLQTPSVAQDPLTALLVQQLQTALPTFAPRPIPAQQPLWRIPQTVRFAGAGHTGQTAEPPSENQTFDRFGKGKS